MSEPERFESWAVLELMGHVRMGGRVSEENRFGVVLGRIDVPKEDGFTTVYFGGQSVYRLTPTTEEIARSVAAGAQPRPVHQYELPAPRAEAPANRHAPEEDPYDDEDDDWDRDESLDVTRDIDL